MKLFASKVFKTRINHSKILVFLIAFCSLLLLITSFNSNAQAVSRHSTLSIEKAKELFSQTRIKEATAQDRGGDEEENVGIQMRLGWDNGAEYHNDLFNIDVVEIPILESNLSKTFQVAGDWADSNGYVNNGQIEKLLVTEDTNGIVKFSILKLSGTTDYLAANDMKVNSFKSMDSDFEGLAGYYNLEDSLLKNYVIRSGGVHEVMESHEVEDRWALCIVGWITIAKCTGSKHHNCENRSECECGANTNCKPPVCSPILEQCGGPQITYNPGPNHTVLDPSLPEPQGSTYGNGGSINTGTCNCLRNYIDQYFTNYSPELVFPYNGYWFNIDYILVGTNCKNGTFTSGTYKAYLAPGQSANGQEIEPKVDMFLCELDYKTQLSSCKWQVYTHYQGNITFHVVYTVGPWSLEDHRTEYYERWPDFNFE